MKKISILVAITLSTITATSVTAENYPSNSQAMPQGGMQPMQQQPMQQPMQQQPMQQSTGQLMPMPQPGMQPHPMGMPSTPNPSTENNLSNKPTFVDDNGSLKIANPNSAPQGQAQNPVAPINK